MIGDTPRAILAALLWAVVCLAVITIAAGLVRLFLDIIGVI